MVNFDIIKCWLYHLIKMYQVVRVQCKNTCIPNNTFQWIMIVLKTWKCFIIKRILLKRYLKNSRHSLTQKLLKYYLKYDILFKIALRFNFIVFENNFFRVQMKNSFFVEAHILILNLKFQKYVTWFYNNVCTGNNKCWFDIFEITFKFKW